MSETTQTTDVLISVASADGCTCCPECSCSSCDTESSCC